MTRLRVDWSFGPGRHPVAGACLAAATALSVTMVLALITVPWWWPLAAGATMATIAAAMAGWQNMPGAAVAYRGVCWLAAGAWSSWTITVPDGGPWSRWPLGTLALGTAVAATVGVGLGRVEAAEPRHPLPQPSQPRPARDPLAAEWQQRLRDITRRQVTVTRVAWWQPRTGYTLHVTLPADGTTAMYLKACETQLAAAADLPEGCNVEVLPTSRRRQVHIRVAIENAMVQTHHVPEDTSALWVEHPLPIGVHADRSLATIHLRFACGVLVGQTDSGKSNTLNVITHQLVRCVDTVVWAVDCSGNGRMPRPWVRPWYEGRAQVPAVDWAAVTPEEALLMAQAAINIINGRTAAYQQRMFEANEDKLPVGPDVPQIVILVDEFADLPEDVKAGLETVSNTGRGAGVRLVSSVLRANSMYIPRSMIVQARERIGMRVSDEAELQYLFDATWSRGRFDPAAVPYQGCGLVSSNAAPPQPFKAWRLEPARIDKVAVEAARLRPELDKVSAQLADTIVRQRRDGSTQTLSHVYAGRWERTLPVMFPATAGGGGKPAQTAAPAAEAAEPAATVAVTGQAERGEPVMDLDESAEAVRRAVERARAAREATERQQEPGADWDTVKGWLVDAARERPTWQVRIRQIVQANRRDGIGPRAVWQQLQSEGYPTAEQTVISTMRADVASGVLAQPGGRGQPYVPGPEFSLDVG